MWDARLEAVRDRKLNEMVIFAAMIRTDMRRRHELIGIIDMLSEDLDVLDAILNDKEVPESLPITSEFYRGRLSRLELLGEEDLDACRVLKKVAFSMS